MLQQREDGAGIFGEGETGRAFADLGHELKLPLQVIKGYSGLLLDELGGDAAAKRLRRGIAAIYDNSVRMQGMVEELLELLRLRGNRFQPRPERVLARRLLGPLCEELGVVAGEKEIDIHCDCPAWLAAWADPKSLRCIAGNLISNAVKFTPYGGLVHVRACRRGRWAVFGVRDTGPGIDPRERQAVFERFHQSDPELSGPGSLGLGLHIAKSLVELHGGRIWAENSPGGGALLRFTLPAADAGGLA